MAELLAPAGDWDSLVAAVQNGADAVYLGGKAFNARIGATNFEETELQRAIDYAHVRGVKVYVTVNILLSEREVREALRFLHFLQRAGADAVIVQDLGLAALVREVIPELDMHASTQVTAHNLPAVEKLAELGFKRVVLAREMGLTEIAAVKRATDMQLEVFVHGALCICYSGQCLFSSMVGGRSGNRGRCAQPCRLRYVLVDEKGRPLVEPKEVGEHLLSPRDLNLSLRLPELIDAGIDAFKIEGRMKRAEYVATVVRVYRQLIDRALRGEFYLLPQEARDLAQIFNRDFTTGYFFGHPGQELMSTKRPNNRGLFLGRVVRYEREGRRAQVKLEEPLREGDGLEVWVSQGGRLGTVVHALRVGGQRVEEAPAGAVAEILLPEGVQPGDRLFKTHDAALVEKARATFASPQERRKIPVSFWVRAKINEPLYLEVRDEEGHAGCARGEFPAQPAATAPLTPAFFSQQLDRLGNTPFFLKEVHCELDENIMVPASDINRARRRAIASLEEARRAAARPAPPLPAEIFAARMKEAFRKFPAVGKGGQKELRLPVLAAAVTDTDSLRAAVSAGAGLVYFGGEWFRSGAPVGEREIREGAEICRAAGVSFVLSTPRIVHDNEMPHVERLFTLAAELGAEGVLVGNLGLLARAESYGLPAYADLAFNVFNPYTAAWLLEQGVAQVALSPELTREQIKEIASGTGARVEVLVQGRVELMVSRYCAPGGLLGGFAGGRRCVAPCRGKRFALKDRLGVLFPLEVDQFCRMHLFNSRDLCLLDDLPELLEMGVGVLRIDARGRGPGYTRDTVRAYRQALKLALAGRTAQLKKLREELYRYSPDGFTKGHFYRGVE